MARVELLFLGTGTSAGVPMIGCHCPVCTSADPRDKRTRPSVVISSEGTRVLVDASPELRLQAVANGVDSIDAVVLTHGHADHIMGLDDVRRFNALRNGPLDVWADRPTHDVLGRCFAYAFREPTPEMKVFRPHLIPRHIHGPFEIGPLRWTPVPMVHGEGRVLGFRVGKLAYCTDVSAVPEAAYALLGDLDVLVIDGLQFRKHPTHLTVEEAIAVSRRTGARQTYLTHMSHQVGHEATSRMLPPGVQLAYDGLRVSADLNDRA